MLDVAATLNSLPASVLAPCSVPNTAATGPLSIHTSDHIPPPPPPLLLLASNSFPPPPSGYKVATSGYKSPQGPAPVFSLTPSNSLSLSCSLIQPCWPILFLKYPKGGSHLRAFVLAVCSTSVLSPPDICMASSCISFTFLLKHHLLGEAFPDHHMQHPIPEPCPPLFF